MFKMADVIIRSTLAFFDNVYKHTEYEDDAAADAESVYQQLQSDLPQVAASPDGRKITTTFTGMAKTICNEGTFMDMIKILWRMVKPMGGVPEFRLALFLLGIGTIIESLKNGRCSGMVTGWSQKAEKWLGRQLTIGGKGCAGDGEGSVVDRIKRFFSTPYLHDFD